MALVFLDTNILIDIFEERRDVDLPQLTQNNLFCSPLSVHIYTYTYKHKMPYEELVNGLKKLEVEFVPMSRDTALAALSGPTTDFEDNIQLHSAAEAKCDYFLTNDKGLQNMKYFGKTKILQKLPN